MDYAQVRSEQQDEAADHASAAQDGATGVFAPLLTAAAGLSITAAAAADAARALKTIRTDRELLQAIELVLKAARRQAARALSGAIVAGWRDDAGMRAKALQAASTGLAVSVDLPRETAQALKQTAILGHAPADVAAHLVEQARYAIQGALGQPLTGPGDPTSITSALGQVAAAHGTRVKGAVTEGYYAGAKAAAVDLGKALSGDSPSITVEIDLDQFAKTIDLTPERRKALEQGGLDPEQIQYRYCTCQDDRVRPSHAALQGSVWSLGNPFAPVPPLGYGCRCWIEYLAKPGSSAAAVLPAAERPVETKAELFRTALDKHVTGWEDLAAAAAKEKPADQFAYLQHELRKRMASSDAQQFAMMIQEATR